MNTFSKALYVMVGGGVGSYLRYLLQTWVQHKNTNPFPYATLLINVSGSFFIGFLLTAFAEAFEVAPQWRLFLTVGVLGGFTTFSAAAWETHQLFSLGYPVQGMLYIAGSLFGSAIGVVLGVYAGRGM